MKSLGLSRYALTIGAAGALLAGCGGSQPPIGAPGATPQSRAVPADAERRGSWMLPDAKSGDLLYVIDGSLVRVFTYPGGQLVGTIQHLNSPVGACADPNGDVFIVESLNINEYAHGGTQPIATLSNPSGYGFGCAVDPTTGNLAVVNDGSRYVSTEVLIYPNASGVPVGYAVPHIGSAFNCVYDGRGNLFVQGASDFSQDPPNALDELFKGGSTFFNVRLKTSVGDFTGPTGLQWDGKHIVIGDQSPDAYQYKIRGRIGRREGEMAFNDASYVYQFWLQGHRIIVPSPATKHVFIYDYPAGGDPIETIPVTFPEAATVSLAPK